MASRYSASVSPRLEAQLQRDLQAGRPIHFRKLLGQRRYFNPNTGDIVSEHYVLRYRHALGEVEPAGREALRIQSKSIARRTRVRTLNLLESYTMRQNALGNPITVQQARNDPQFYQLYNDLRLMKADMVGMTPYDKDRMIQPGGMYANTLVQLGRRLSTEINPVDWSPDKGSYVTGTVFPALQRGQL